MTTPRDTDAGEPRAQDAGPRSARTSGQEPAPRTTTPQTAAPGSQTTGSGATGPGVSASSGPGSTADPARRPEGAPSGPGWSASPSRQGEDPQPTTVLPAGGRPRPAVARPVAGGSRPPAATATARPIAGRTRKARLTLRRIDPWSVFVFSLVAAVFLGIALVVAVAALYAVLGSLGVTGSLNSVFAEVTGGDATAEPLLTGGRIVGGAAVLAAVNVVLLTLLATLGALLYNVCASFTGGLELVFGERD